MWPCVWPPVCACVWQPTPKTADVTVTKIAGYVRVRVVMNRWFFRIFGNHSFYATATLLNIWISMQRPVWRKHSKLIHPLPLEAVANNYRHEYHHGCGLWTLVVIIDCRNEGAWYCISSRYLKLVFSKETSLSRITPALRTLVIW